jgi:anti-sigma factor RsiW
VDAHLARCPACRVRLAELEVLPGLLGLLSADDFAELSGPGPAASAVPAAPTHPVGHRRSGRRRVVTAAAGLAVAASLIGAVTVLNGPAPASRTVSAASTRTAVRATVTMSNNQAGAALTLRLFGVTPQQTCSLIAIDRAGRRETAATWLADYEGEAVVHGQTAIQTEDVARLEIVDGRQRTLLTLPVG